MLGRLLIGMVRFYRVAVSPLTPPSCRYVPTCSAYAIEAIERHGAGTGSWLTLRRIGRCHPWGGHGYDPVPPLRGERDGSRPFEPGSPDPAYREPASRQASADPRDERLTTG